METIVNGIVNGLKGAFGDNPALIVFLVSMVPMIEVRGAIPIGVSLGMKLVPTALLSAVSALVVCPILILCLKPILDYLKKTKLFKKIALKVENMFKSKAMGIEDKGQNLKQPDPKKTNLYKALGLFLFVAFPLPGTGVWTGSAVAAFMDFKLKYSIPTIVLGNISAAIIISLMTFILGDKSYIIILALFVFIVITVAGLLLTLFFKNKNAKKSEQIQAEDEKQDTQA